MADPKIVREWLDKADEDFAFANTNLEEGNRFYAQICYHFHQAAEKYLKAFIVSHDLEFEKMHNLINLLKVCTKKDPSLEHIADDCKFLNKSYIDTRYPVHWPTDYTAERAMKSKDAAKHLGLAQI